MEKLASLEHEVQSSVSYWAFIVFRDFEKSLNEELAPHGITLRQSQVLGWLALQRELTQTQLAELMKLEPPTLVRILDRMERDGWIRRHPISGDKRKKIIRPTSQVASVWKRVRQCIMKVRSQATHGISEKQLLQARKVLMAMHHNLEEQTCLEELSR